MPVKKNQKSTATKDIRYIEIELYEKYHEKKWYGPLRLRIDDYPELKGMSPDEISRFVNGKGIHDDPELEKKYDDFFEKYFDTFSIDLQKIVYNSTRIVDDHEYTVRDADDD